MLASLHHGFLFTLCQASEPLKYSKTCLFIKVWGTRQVADSRIDAATEILEDHDGVRMRMCAPRLVVFVSERLR